jgi:predicted metal-binding protein
LSSIVTVCDTCRRKGWDPASGVRDGARLAERMEAAARAAGDVEVRRHSCFIHCASACNIEVHAPDKLRYLMGRFDPLAQDPEPILAFARLHAAAPTGNVPFRKWPEGLQRHFIERRPPLPQTALIR